MGRDKTGIPLPFGNGASLVQWAADRIARVCVDWIVADNGRALVQGAVSVTDGPGAGPVAGILGAAAHVPTRPLLVLACDLPLIPACYLAELAAATGDWVVPITAQGPEPLCALYGLRALDALRDRVHLGQLSLRDLGDRDPKLALRRIHSKDLMSQSFGTLEQIPAGQPHGFSSDIFFSNANRPQDLELMEELGKNAALQQDDFLRLDSTKG